MLSTVVQVYPTRDFKVSVYFADGMIKLYDVKPLIDKGGVFAQISNIDDFIKKCTVLNGTLAWDLSGRFDPTQCLDVDPDIIYQEGLSAKDPLDSSSSAD